MALLLALSQYDNAYWNELICQNEAVASAQSGLIRDIDFQMQNVGIFGDSMSGYNADGTVWIRNHWTVERAEASGDELNNYLDTEYNTNYISMAPVTSIPMAFIYRLL